MTRSSYIIRNKIAENSKKFSRKWLEKAKELSEYSSKKIDVIISKLDDEKKVSSDDEKKDKIKKWVEDIFSDKKTETDTDSDKDSKKTETDTVKTDTDKTVKADKTVKKPDLTIDDISKILASEDKSVIEKDKIETKDKILTLVDKKELPKKYYDLSDSLWDTMIFDATTKDILANFSDVWDSLEEVALNYAQEENRENIMKKEKWIFGFVKSTWKKFVNFFNRDKKVEKLKNQKMNDFASSSLFSQENIRSNASHRYQTLLNNDTLKNLSLRKVNTDKYENPEINSLWKSYVNWEIDEMEFKQKFDEIVSYDEELNNIFNTNWIKQKWTNVLNVLKSKRKLLDMIRSLNIASTWDIDSILNKYLSNIDNINYLSELWINLKDKDSKEKLLKSLLDERNFEILKSKPVNIKFDIIKWWEWAFKINDFERKEWNIFKTWAFLDKHPVISWIITTTSLVWTSAMWALFYPLRPFLWWGFMWWLNFVKRWTWYTKEMDGYEQRIVRWEDDKARILQSLDVLQDQLDDVSTWKVKKMLLKSKIKSLNKKLKLYSRNKIKWEVVWNDKLDIEKWTIHKHFYNIEKLNEYINNNLVWSWKNLEKWLVIWLSRLDLYAKTWHNFLKSSSKENLEEQMNLLIQNISFVVNNETYWISMESLRNSEFYKWVSEFLEVDYKKWVEWFKETRKKDSIKKWVTYWSIYAASNILTHYIWSLISWTEVIPTSNPKTLDLQDQKLMTLLKDSNLIDWNWKVLVWNEELAKFINSQNWYSCDPSTLSVFVSWYEMDPAIASQMKNILWNNYDKFISNLQNVKTPETLWDTLTNDIFNNKQLWNNAKNQIMSIIMNATYEHNWKQIPELFVQAVYNENFFNEVMNWSQRLTHILTDLLPNWWYWSDFTYDKLKDLVVWLQNNTVDWFSLDTATQTKLNEVMFCYVHKSWESMWSPMWEVFMDKSKNFIWNIWNTSYIWEDIINKGTNWLGWLALPLFRNTTMSPIDNDMKYKSTTDASKLSYMRSISPWEFAEWRSLREQDFSETIKANSDSKLDFKTEFSLFNDKVYSKDKPRYDLSNELSNKFDLNSTSKMIVSIPCYVKESNLEHTLEKYWEQSFNDFEIVLLLNSWTDWMSLDDHNKNVRKRLDEINRVKSKYPHLKINVIDKQFPWKVKVGHIRAILWDIIWINSLKNGISDPIVISNDADVIDINIDYMKNIYKNFESNDSLDFILWRIEWDSSVENGASKENPELLIWQRFLQIMDASIRRIETLKSIQNLWSSWANSAYRLSSYYACWWYDLNDWVWEDVVLWNRLKYMRYKKWNSYIDEKYHKYVNSAKIQTSPRRAIKSILLWKTVVEQWHKFDSMLWAWLDEKDLIKEYKKNSEFIQVDDIKNAEKLDIDALRKIKHRVEFMLKKLLIEYWINDIERIQHFLKASQIKIYWNFSDIKLIKNSKWRVIDITWIWVDLLNSNWLKYLFNYFK